MKPSHGITVFTDITTMAIKGERSGCRAGGALLGLPHNGGQDAVNDGGCSPPCCSICRNPSCGGAVDILCSGFRGWYSVPCDVEDGPCPACFLARQAQRIAALVTRMSGPRCPPRLGSLLGSLRFRPADAAEGAPAMHIRVRVNLGVIVAIHVRGRWGEALTVQCSAAGYGAATATASA